MELSLPLESGGVERGELCHSEIKELGRMSLLGSEKETFSSFLFYLEHQGSAKAPAVLQEKHLFIHHAFHADVLVLCRFSLCVGLLSTLSGETVFFLELEGREGGALN